MWLHVNVIMSHFILFLSSLIGRIEEELRLLRSEHHHVVSQGSSVAQSQLMIQDDFKHQQDQLQLQQQMVQDYGE